MKRIFTVLSLLALIPLGLMLQSKANGVAETQDQDRTGAPGSANPCSQCHGGGNFAAQAQLLLIDPATSLPVNLYTPGETYLVTPALTQVGGSVFGFQATALLDDNSNAGTFSDPQLGVQLEDVDGRHIIEHSSPSPVAAWGVDWTAPEAGSGDVTFYMSGNACNGNGTTSGDEYVGGEFTFAEGDMSVSNEINKEVSMNAYFNAEKTLVVEISESMLGAELVVYDLQGREMKTQKLNEPSTMMALELPMGQYIVLAQKGAITESVRIVR